MKRYRVLNIDFDSRAHILDLVIEEWWDPVVKGLHRQNKQVIRQGLVAEFGAEASEHKIRNFSDLGTSPFSVVAYHNRFLRQIRYSFVIGGYYPALTAACALGERILNHLLLALRDCFKNTPQYKSVYSKQSFDNWEVPISTLETWGILQTNTVKGFRELKGIRDRAIHFRPETDHNDRQLALEAIHTLNKIIESQFDAGGSLPWFIPDTPGASFLKKSAENDPFIRIAYLPSCVRVGPWHRLDRSGTGWFVCEDLPCGDHELSDEQFAALFNERSKNPVP